MHLEALFLCQGCFDSGKEQRGSYTAGEGIFEEQRRDSMCPLFCGFCRNRFSKNLSPRCSGYLPQSLWWELFSAAAQEQRGSFIYAVNNKNRDCPSKGRLKGGRVLRQAANSGENSDPLLPTSQLRTVFLDWNGCFAVTFHSSNGGFCGWCLKDCGRDAPPSCQSLLTEAAARWLAASAQNTGQRGSSETPSVTICSVKSHLRLKRGGILGC